MLTLKEKFLFFWRETDSKFEVNEVLTLKTIY